MTIKRVGIEGMNCEYYINHIKNSLKKIFNELK